MMILDERVYDIAMAGNPNVGKSSIFNGLTGLHQHTGNWAGKTVETTWGLCHKGEKKLRLWDLPGTYALYPHSKEEEVARDFLLFHPVDAVVVVCDICALERNLPLLFQAMLVHEKVVLCVNLIDEGAQRGMTLDVSILEGLLGIPVVATVAKESTTLAGLVSAIEGRLEGSGGKGTKNDIIPYELQDAVDRLSLALQEDVVECGYLVATSGEVSPKIPAYEFLSLGLLMEDRTLEKAMKKALGFSFQKRLSYEKEKHFLGLELGEIGLSSYRIREKFVTGLMEKSEEISRLAVRKTKANFDERDRKLDGYFLRPKFAFPLMALGLVLVFWLTIIGANYPSAMLSSGFGLLEEKLLLFTASWVWWIREPLILGVYRVLSWVVSVMLPPMAIFFPLFALLEDAGFLPRMAFHLDRAFSKAKTCGKQAITMSMGFACNAAGVLSCRIIDSPKEKLLAMVTNNFVPCNGRFPTLIAIIAMFFVGLEGGLGNSLLSALILCLFILLGAFLGLVSTKILASTLLKVEESHFVLELPPYRKPQIGKVFFSTLVSKTLVILKRAVIVAAPAGLVIWLLSNLTWGDYSILWHFCDFLEPFALYIGLDGVILMAFLLGLPANEIVFPLILMGYLGTGAMVEMDSLSAMRDLLILNGWTTQTALCTMVFSLLHFPCATTIFTIAKESSSVKLTLISVLLPTALGLVFCRLITVLSPCFLG